MHPTAAETLKNVQTALTLIVQTASYVERIVRGDGQVGSLKLALYARVNSSKTSGQNESEIQALWGPVLKPAAPENDKTTTVHKPLETNRCNVQNAEIDIARAEVVPQKSKDAATNSKIYTIPSEAAARCLSFFVTSSGYTLHPSSIKDKSLETVKARSLTAAVKAIYNAHMAIIRRKTKTVSGVRYQSLVARFLRVQGAEVILPKIVLKRGKSGTACHVTGSQKVLLKIEKSDRNSKEVSFALLATLIQCPPPGTSRNSMNLRSFVFQVLHPTAARYGMAALCLPGIIH